MTQHDTLTLREALRSIQYEAASLADAQVIALQALNATYPASAALSATQPAQAKQSDAASEAFSAMADAVPFHNGWVKPQAAQGEPEGWKIVPVEPTWDMKTVAMVLADREWCYHIGRDDAKKLWSAMLTASPTPPAQPAVAQGAGEVDTGPRVLREVLSVCEDTMDKMALETTEFRRGRAFEAKGISRAIGTWFQDEFCGLSHMGEPVAAPTQPAAGADVLDAQRYRWLRRKVCAIQVWNFSGEKVSAAEFEFINLPRLEEVPTKADEALDSAIDAAIAASGRQE